MIPSRPLAAVLVVVLARVLVARCARSLTADPGVGAYIEILIHLMTATESPGGHK